MSQNIFHSIYRKAHRFVELFDAIYQQNHYDLSEIQSSKALVVFLIPHLRMVNGGIMSIFSLCQHSRLLLPDAKCIIATPPGIFTHSRNNGFINDEKIYRWSQVINCISSEQKVILNIPECEIEGFLRRISSKDQKFLRNLSSLHINIMDQNIDLMPDVSAIEELKQRISPNVTQTTAHTRYTCQEFADKFNIPTHRWGFFIDFSVYPSYSWNEKEKVFVISPDRNHYKEQILGLLKKEFPDFKLYTFNDIPFSTYMEKIARSLFTFTFGEGFDGYFNQPSLFGSMSFSVYNERFFPDKSWLELPNVYPSYEVMMERIVSDIKEYLNNEKKYDEVVQRHHNKVHPTRLKKEEFLQNLKRFYEGNYDFLPTCK